MKKNVLVLAAVAAASSTAFAQDGGLSFAAGLKAWNTQWTTFSYATTGFLDQNGQPRLGERVLTQVAAEDKTIFLPLVSVRWRDFFASVSGYSTVEYQMIGGGVDKRNETDVNVGWFVMPTVALTLGYKKLSQRREPDDYALAGPVLGVSATAPLGSAFGGAFSMYGAFGIGQLKPQRNVKIDADYRLSELGFAYNLAVDRIVKTVALTAGYRVQVFNSKDALPEKSQDGRDLTQGLTFGVVASF